MVTGVVAEVVVSEEQGIWGHGKSLFGVAGAALGCDKMAPGGLRWGTTGLRPQEGHLMPVMLRRY